MPRRGMVEISKYKKQFEQAGTKVMVDDYPHVSLLNDKAAAYNYFRKEGIGEVPDYYLVTNAAQFEDAYHPCRKNTAGYASSSFTMKAVKLSTD